MAEIRIFPLAYAPKAWALCQGQFMPINQNQALFALLGTRFGGNGQTNFQLPDMRGRIPIHVGGSISSPGEKGGEVAHTISVSEMPTHTHVLFSANADGDVAIPATNLLAKSPNQYYHAPDANLTLVNPNSVTSVGGSQPHTNLMPYTVLNFCIALQGVFPTLN